MGVAGPAGFTTCCSTVEVDAALFASPEYVAVKEWIPVVKAALLHVAVRMKKPGLVRATALQSTVAPTLNVTVPVGWPPLTVAMKVAFWPTIDGLSKDTNATLLVVIFTTCDSGGDVEGAFPTLPEYTAVTECVPTVNSG